MKLCYFYALKALWDCQGKIKMYYGMSRVKKQLSGKRSIGDAVTREEMLLYFNHYALYENYWVTKSVS